MKSCVFSISSGHFGLLIELSINSSKLYSFELSMVSGDFSKKFSFLHFFSCTNQIAGNHDRIHTQTTHTLLHTSPNYYPNHTPTLLLQNVIQMLMMYLSLFTGHHSQRHQVRQYSSG